MADDIKERELKFKKFELHFTTTRDIFKNEHTRWYGWTFIFLSIIAAIFYSYTKIPNKPPISFFFFVAAVVSFFWIIVILSIKASTNAWHQTLCEFDEKNIENPFKKQKRIFKAFCSWREFWSTFGFMEPPEEYRDNDNNSSNKSSEENKKRKKSQSTVEKENRNRHFFFHKSVTKTLIMLSTTMTLVFLSLFIWSLLLKLHILHLLGQWVNIEFKYINILSPFIILALVIVAFRVAGCEAKAKGCTGCSRSEECHVKPNLANNNKKKLEQ